MILTVNLTEAAQSPLTGFALGVGGGQERVRGEVRAYA